MDLALNNQQWLIYHKTKPNLDAYKCMEKKLGSNYTRMLCTV